MSRSRTILWTVVLTLLIVAILAGGGVYAVRKWKPTVKPETVQIRVVKRGPLTELVQAPGEVTPKKKVAISARIAARIMELPFDEGMTVTAGRPQDTPPVPASTLVRLDGKDLSSKLRSAEAGKAAQQAELEVAKARIASEEAGNEAASAALAQFENDLERKRKLLATGDVGQATFDDLELKVREQRARLASARHVTEAAQRNLVVLQHRLDAAQAMIDEARDALAYTTITSPIDGIVTRLNAEVGELVVTGTMNNPGTVIMEVADLSRMLVVAQVDEADMGRLAVGQAARIHIHAYGSREFDGRVDTIPLTSSRSQSGTNVYRVEILLDTQGERLYTGLTADVEIRTREHTELLLIPSQAAVGRKLEDLPKDIREGSPLVDPQKTYATVVYRMINGKAVATPVKLGPADLTQTIVEAGLSEGDTVIVGPYKTLDTLKHDAAVEEEKPGAALAADGKAKGGDKPRP